MSGPKTYAADVFIAGSGPIGSTLAKQFIDAGLSVVMVEQGSADSFTRIKDNKNADVFVPGSHKKNTIEYQKDIDRFVYVIKSALSSVSVPVSDMFIKMLTLVHVTSPLHTLWKKMTGVVSYNNRFPEENYFSVRGSLSIQVLSYPTVWGARSPPGNGCSCPCVEPQPTRPVSNGKNPNQIVNFNLPAEAVTRGVGGMSTHWTCSTPRFHKTVELPTLDASSDVKNIEEWDRLYTMAENLIGTTRTAFDKSIRHNLVLRTLQAAYDTPNDTPPAHDWLPDDGGDKRRFYPLALACNRLENPDYVFWHAADTILQEIYADAGKRDKLTLLTNTGCKYLKIGIGEGIGGKAVTAAMCYDYLHSATAGITSSPEVIVNAKYYVIATGAVATPQILFNTEYKDNAGTALFPNLGKYITEQTLSFCQIILKKELMESVPKNPFNLDWWKLKVEEHIKDHPEDPLRFPFHDPEPQVTTPLTMKKRWHTQIHRDAFSYGAVAATIDTRTIVDFRFFGYIEPREVNTITFEKNITDAFGMPQPTFHFELSDDDAQRAHEMMKDMCDMASTLGGYLPGSEPQFMEPGLALHLGGTVRAGPTKEKHVADTKCKVFDFENLYVGGNGVIPTGFAANPTLTSICYAFRTAEDIIEKIKSRK